LNVEPAWSPDGSKIAFVSSREAGPYKIYVMAADGTSQRRLTFHPSRDDSPSWSRYPAQPATLN
jgi:TolB protein